MTFDSLTYARRLKGAGFPEAQAEALADANRDLLVQDLVTKTDLVPIQTDIAVLKGDVAGLKADSAVMKGDITAMKADMAVLKGDVSVLKADVAGLKADVTGIKTDLATFKSAVRADFQKLDTSVEALTLRMTVRLGAMMAASIALLGGILRLH